MPTGINGPPIIASEFDLGGGKGLWHRLRRLRDGLPTRKGFVPVRPELVAEVKFFGRYRAGWIRDGVLLSVS